MSRGPFIYERSLRDGHRIFRLQKYLPNCGALPYVGTIRHRLRPISVGTIDIRGSMSGVDQPAAARRSVLLVEDEVMIRMMVSDMLDELGYAVAAEAGDIDEAVRLVQCTDFDIAILDVNVNGKVISPVAEAVQMRSLPFIFATGYGSQGLPEKFRDRPTLQKPFQMETLARAIENVLKDVAA